ncbi:hypothetical protein TGRUB_223400 [Toxoplasma gondii RUB]|uniref:Uncharacterized protein n=1 Tax=Toxoplasma gondii RUB TaxID=935652 RepID=A0A086LKW8_TOXGO|nr:hypothetical protein TGRUB_223400 [Toxoplasma gondii RUB]
MRQLILLCTTILLLLLSSTPRANAQDEDDDEGEQVEPDQTEDFSEEDEDSEQQMNKPASYMEPSISPAGFVHSNKWRRFRDRLDPTTLRGDTAPERSFRNLVRHYYDVTEESYPKPE